VRLSIALLLLGFTAPAWANIVQNPGFETGDLTGWSGSGWYVATSGGLGPSWATFQTSCDPCPLWQGLTTTWGVLYQLNFAYSSGSDPAAELRVLWNGVQIADILGPTNGWVQFSYSGLAVSRDAITRLEFDGRYGSSSGGLDDVNADSQVPEPGSLFLAAGGALVLAWRRCLK
jgi:hypothetical protein